MMSTVSGCHVTRVGGDAILSRMRCDLIWDEMRFHPGWDAISSWMRCDFILDEMRFNFELFLNAAAYGSRIL